MHLGNSIELKSKYHEGKPDQLQLVLGNSIELKSKCHEGKPDQLHPDLRAPNLSFDMLHEHPRRNYNIHHLTANTNMCKIHIYIKLVML